MVNIGQTFGIQFRASILLGQNRIADTGPVPLQVLGQHRPAKGMFAGYTLHEFRDLRGFYIWCKDWFYKQLQNITDIYLKWKSNENQH